MLTDVLANSSTLGIVIYLLYSSHFFLAMTYFAFTCLLASMISLGCKISKSLKVLWPRMGPLGSRRSSGCLTSDIQVCHRMDMTAARCARGDYSAENFWLIQICCE